MCATSGWEMAVSSKFNNGFVCGSLIASALWFVFLSFVCESMRGDWQRAAIKHDAARYHPATGHFEWIEKERD